MNTPLFSVIIPVFNKWELTENCLRSLAEHTAGYDYEVLVVDNASTDRTATELSALGESLFGKRFAAIRYEENRNYGPACNAGAQRAAAPLLFFLNNDTLLTPGWAAPLLAALGAGSANDALATDDSLGAVGPLLLYDDNTVQHLGVALDTSGLTHLYRGFPADHPLVGKKRRLQALTAAALLMPRELFWACGCFHEGYRNGFEDLELCVRIRQQGKKLACVPASRVYHLESQTPGRKDSEKENALLFHSRCGKELYYDLHQHGQRDGFRIELDDALGTCLLLNENDDQALRQDWSEACCNATGNPNMALYKLTCQNPYWLWGYETLADNLEKAGDYELASYCHNKILNHAFTRKALENAMQILKRSGNAELISKSMPQLTEMEATIPTPAAARHKLEYFLRQAETRHDKLLAELCRNKLSELNL
ncbi:MAG: glycosyltransferase family 2 protein [Deltaproteobacteria bacterium]|jgi:GT2 family glycosyltransferase|nr:glycosyltransferase family 2 protein [Deltaproteobacteria bacterium]